VAGNNTSREGVSPLIPLGLGLAAGAAGAAIYMTGREVERAPAEEKESPPTQPTPQPVQPSLPPDLRSVVSLLEAINTKLGSLIGELRVTGSTVTINSEDLNTIIQAAAREGDTMFPTYQASVLVPAGKSVTIDFNIPDNFVDTKRKPLYISSDYYDPDITVEVIVDYSKKVTPSKLSLTVPLEVDFGSLYVKRRAVTLAVNNGSTVDATITYRIECALLHVSLYDDWYRIIVDYAVSRLSEIARLMGGRSL